MAAARCPIGRRGRCKLVDRYIHGTHLRLRRVTTDDDLTFKLAQKIRVADTDPERVMLTNLYLSAGEHDTLAVLPADVVTKTRWAVSWAGVGGHEIVPGGGHVAARWWPTVLPGGGRLFCPR